MGPKPPLVTVPTGSPAGVENRAAFARRSAVVRADADAAARRRFGQLAQDTRGAGEAAFGSAPLADRPGEPGLDRARRLVDVVAVEAQPGLEPQRIARAEPDRRDLGLGQQRLRQRRRHHRRAQEISKPSSPV